MMAEAKQQSNAVRRARSMPDLTSVELCNVSRITNALGCGPLAWRGSTWTHMPEEQAFIRARDGRPLINPPVVDNHYPIEFLEGVDERSRCWSAPPQE